MNERFWKKVAIGGPDECWIWTANRNNKGYGLFRPGGLLPKKLAHRISCELANGPPPGGKAFALHSCDNPACVNPKHLRWGDQKDNMQDAIERDRKTAPPLNFTGRNTGKMPSGEAVHNQSLTEEMVRTIWRLHLSNDMNISQIAHTVGAKSHAVADVCRGRSWRHLEGAPAIEALKAGGKRRGVNQFTHLSAS